MTDGKRLVLADPLSTEGLKILEESTGIMVEDLSHLSREELKQRVPGAAGLVVRSRTLVDRELIEAAAGLEVIGRAGVGTDNIDLEAATRRGVAVLNAPAGNTLSTAELTFGLLLAAARGIPTADRSMHEGRWERSAVRGAQLSGKTLGVVGAGRIGTEVVHRAKAFGMNVLVADPYLSPERVSDLGVELVSLDELLERSDYVTLHIPLTDESRMIMDARRIASMRPDAVLINAARGGLVDESALANALREGKLKAAALDAFETEPLPEDHPLRSVPNLVMTPHIGAATPEAQREISLEIAAAMRDALLDGDPRTQHEGYRTAREAFLYPLRDRRVRATQGWSFRDSVNRDFFIGTSWLLLTQKAPLVAGPLCFLPASRPAGGGGGEWYGAVVDAADLYAPLYLIP